MNGAASHDRLLRRYSLRAELVTETALHIGTGEASGVDATDMPVARDGRGRPYVPGSSFRGAFRSSLESLLRGLGRQGRRVCNPFDRSKTGEDRSCAERVADARRDVGDMTEERAFQFAWDESCEICRLFGNLFLASRVRVADLPLLSEPEDAPTYSRDGVGLDRDLRTASRGILYNFEALAAGSRFGLRLEVENAGDHEMGLLLVGLDLFREGFARLGGKSARGLGLVQVENPAIVRRTAEDFFTAGSPGTLLAVGDLEGFRAAARGYYVGGNA